MEKVILKAEKRELTGKQVKVLRREGKLPAVIYGKGIESTPIVLDRKETTTKLGKVSSSTILTIDLAGKEQPTLVREIQKDFIKNEIIHIDFLAVSLKEKLRTAVSINLTGESPALKEYDAMVVPGIEHIEVECLPQDLPESITVDLSTLKEIGDAIYVKDLPAIANVEFLTNPEDLVVVVSAVKEEAIVEEVVEGAEGAAEPEVIEHGKKEEEGEEE
ncbi:MAG: 50S ribosomal protein L25 [Anaerolineae bacterium]|nr:50S ribosomal protein L25 [Anaerolineae bacterium]